MQLPEVNILVYARRVESPEHERYAEWLTNTAQGPEPFALSELGASGFVRIVTNPEIWPEPTSIKDALEFIQQLRSRSNALAHARSRQLGHLRSAVPCGSRSRQARCRRLPCRPGYRPRL